METFGSLISSLGSERVRERHGAHLGLASLLQKRHILALNRRISARYGAMLANRSNRRYERMSSGPGPNNEDKRECL